MFQILETVETMDVTVTGSRQEYLKIVISNFAATSRAYCETPGVIIRKAGGETIVVRPS